jgi:hypothetical protein
MSLILPSSTTSAAAFIGMHRRLSWSHLVHRSACLTVRRTSSNVALFSSAVVLIRWPVSS